MTAAATSIDRLTSDIECYNIDRACVCACVYIYSLSFGLSESFPEGRKKERTNLEIPIRYSLVD